MSPELFPSHFIVPLNGRWMAFCTDCDAKVSFPAPAGCRAEVARAATALLERDWAVLDDALKCPRCAARSLARPKAA